MVRNYLNVLTIMFCFLHKISKLFIIDYNSSFVKVLRNMKMFIHKLMSGRDFFLKMEM